MKFTIELEITEEQRLMLIKDSQYKAIHEHTKLVSQLLNAVKQVIIQTPTEKEKT